MFSTRRHRLIVALATASAACDTPSPPAPRQGPQGRHADLGQRPRQDDGMVRLVDAIPGADEPGLSEHSSPGLLAAADAQAGGEASSPAPPPARGASTSWAEAPEASSGRQQAGAAVGPEASEARESERPPGEAADGALRSQEDEGSPAGPERHSDASDLETSPDPAGDEDASPAEATADSPGQPRTAATLRLKLRQAILTALSRSSEDADLSERLQPYFTVRSGEPGGFRQLTFHDLPSKYGKQELFFSSSPEHATEIVMSAGSRDPQSTHAILRVHAVTEQQENVSCSFRIAADEDFRRLFGPSPTDPAAGREIELGGLNCLDIGAARHRSRRQQ